MHWSHSADSSRGGAGSAKERRSLIACSASTHSVPLSTRRQTEHAVRRFAITWSRIAIARLAVVIWVAYFALSGAGLGLKILPLSLVANAVYFVLAIVLFQYFRPGDPLIALALLPLAALGSVVQSIGMIQGDRGIQVIALVFFGLFLATVGYLLLRAGIAPPPIGYTLVAAGLASCALLIPQLPAPLTALVLGFGALAEGAFALWLLVTG